MSATMDVLIANLVNASRAAGFCRGKGLDDTADNRAEDAAIDALKAEIERLRAQNTVYRGAIETILTAAKAARELNDEQAQDRQP